MRSWRIGPVAAAAVVGVLLGGVLYVVHPLHLASSSASLPTPVGSPAPLTTPSTPPSASASTGAPRRPASSRSPSASPSRRVPSGPPFTPRALLQSSEFLQYKWAKADELSLTTGVSAAPILRCLRPDQVRTRPVAAYAATHHGLNTLAGEQVIRYYTVADAKGVFDRLAREVDRCPGLAASRRASVGRRHDPDFDGISQTRWWNLGGVGKQDPMRGVLVIMRVDDRLMALCLTSSATDPAVTTDILPLMRQGGLRLV